MALSIAKYLIIALSLLLSATLYGTAAAQINIPTDGVDLRGFAWSAYTNVPTGGLEGVGWVSANCINTATCSTDVPGGVDYAVTLESDGNLTGYAWSSTVGWIAFDPVGPYPAGSGVANISAGATGGDYNSTLNFSGWARVCAAAMDPVNCTGGANLNAGGWDGWISLGGTLAAGSYGLAMTQAGATADSYAWGGSQVMGWLDFSRLTYVTTLIAPVVTITAPTTPQPAGSVTIAFDLTGGGPPDSCTWSDGVSVNNPILLNAPVISMQSFVVTPTTDTTYTVTCTNASGTDSDTVLVELINTFPDIIIDTVNVNVGSPDTSGQYDPEFIINVSGVPTGVVVSYTIELDGELDITGTFTTTTGSAMIRETFLDVLFNATPIPWTVRIDDVPAPNGQVDEGGGAAEINERTGTLSLSAPTPTVNITVDNIVRSGTAAAVAVTVTTVGESTCSLYGPGLSGITFTVPAGGTYTTSPSLTTAALTNSTQVAVVCDVVGGVPDTQATVIEVVPTYEEV